MCVFVKKEAMLLPIAILATQTRSKQAFSPLKAEWNKGHWYEAVSKAVYRKDAERQKY